MARSNGQSRLDERDQALLRIVRIRTACAVGAAALTVFFSVVAADAAPGAAQSGVAGAQHAASAGTDPGSAAAPTFDPGLGPPPQPPVAAGDGSQGLGGQDPMVTSGGS